MSAWASDGREAPHRNRHAPRHIPFSQHRCQLHSCVVHIAVALFDRVECSPHRCSGRPSGRAERQDEASGLSTLIKDWLPGGASRLASLLLSQILPVFSIVAPCDPGAALRNPVPVQRGQPTSRLQTRGNGPSSHGPSRIVNGSNAKTQRCRRTARWRHAGAQTVIPWPRAASASRRS